MELSDKVKKGGGENAIVRHTKRNQKLLVRERLRLLLDDEDFLELSPLAGLDLPYGDIPAAGCLTGQTSRHKPAKQQMEGASGCLTRGQRTSRDVQKKPRFSETGCFSADPAQIEANSGLS